MTISAEDFAAGNYPKGVPITVSVGGDAHGKSTTEG
jgi:hypothetical protein